MIVIDPKVLKEMFKDYHTVVHETKYGVYYSLEANGKVQKGIEIAPANHRGFGYYPVMPSVVSPPASHSRGRQRLCART